MKSNFLKAMFMTAAGLMTACTAPPKAPDNIYALRGWNVKNDTLELYAVDTKIKDAPVDTFQYLHSQDGVKVSFGNARLMTPIKNEHDRDPYAYSDFSIFSEHGETKFTMEYFTTNADFIERIGAKRHTQLPRGRGADYLWHERVLKIIKHPISKKDSLHVR